MRTALPDAGTVAEALGRRVKAEMDRQGIRQIAVARRLRLSQQAVSRRVVGTVAFSVWELEQIALLLNVPIAYLVSDDTDEAA